MSYDLELRDLKADFICNGAHNPRLAALGKEWLVHAPPEIRNRIQLRATRLEGALPDAGIVKQGGAL